MFLTGAYTGYVEPEVSVTARARLGRPLVSLVDLPYVVMIKIFGYLTRAQTLIIFSMITFDKAFPILSNWQFNFINWQLTILFLFLCFHKNAIFSEQIDHSVQFLKHLDQYFNTTVFRIIMSYLNQSLTQYLFHKLKNGKVFCLLIYQSLKCLIFFLGSHFHSY